MLNYEKNAVFLRLVRCPDAKGIIIITIITHCVLKENDTDVAHYNFNANQTILVILGRDVERVCYQMTICYPTFPN